MNAKKTNIIICVICGLFLGGCSVGIYSTPVEVDVKLASPVLKLNDQIPVVFPAEIGKEKRVLRLGRGEAKHADSYSEYQFN